MTNVTSINTKRDQAIDLAISQFQKARKLYDLRQLQKELDTNPASFTAHVHRLRLPLPSKV